MFVEKNKNGKNLTKPMQIGFIIRIFIKYKRVMGNFKTKKLT
jgi:hypothetical protein